MFWGVRSPKGKQDSRTSGAQSSGSKTMMMKTVPASKRRKPPPSLPVATPVKTPSKKAAEKLPSPSIKPPSGRGPLRTPSPSSSAAVKRDPSANQDSTPPCTPVEVEGSWVVRDNGLFDDPQEGRKSDAGEGASSAIKPMVPGGGEGLRPAEQTGRAPAATPPTQGGVGLGGRGVSIEETSPNGVSGMSSDDDSGAPLTLTSGLSPLTGEAGGSASSSDDDDVFFPGLPVPRPAGAGGSIPSYGQDAITSPDGGSSTGSPGGCHEAGASGVAAASRAAQARLEEFISQRNRQADAEFVEKSELEQRLRAAEAQVTRQRADVHQLDTQVGHLSGAVRGIEMVHEMEGMTEVDRLLAQELVLRRRLVQEEESRIQAEQRLMQVETRLGRMLAREADARKEVEARLAAAEAEQAALRARLKMGVARAGYAPPRSPAGSGGALSPASSQSRLASRLRDEITRREEAERRAAEALQAKDKYKGWLEELKKQALTMRASVAMGTDVGPVGVDATPGTQLPSFSSSRAGRPGREREAATSGPKTYDELVARVEAKRAMREGGSSAVLTSSANGGAWEGGRGDVTGRSPPPGEEDVFFDAVAEPGAEGTEQQDRKQERKQGPQMEEASKAAAGAGSSGGEDRAHDPRLGRVAHGGGLPEADTSAPGSEGASQMAAQVAAVRGEVAALEQRLSSEVAARHRMEQLLFEERQMAGALLASHAGALEGALPAFQSAPAAARQGAGGPLPAPVADALMDTAMSLFEELASSSRPRSAGKMKIPAEAPAGSGDDGLPLMNGAGDGSHFSTPPRKHAPAPGLESPWTQSAREAEVDATRARQELSAAVSALLGSPYQHEGALSPQAARAAYASPPARGGPVFPIPPMTTPRRPAPPAPPAPHAPPGAAYRDGAAGAPAASPEGGPPRGAADSASRARRMEEMAAMKRRVEDRQRGIMERLERMRELGATAVGAGRSEQV